MGRPRKSPTTPKQSPVTAARLSEHYEQYCQRARAGALSNAELMQLIAWEHAELHGKPLQRVAAEVSGGISIEVNVR